MTKAEQFIKDYTSCCSNETNAPNYHDGKVYYPWLTPDQALRAVEIAKEEWLDKACKWWTTVALNEEEGEIGYYLLSHIEDFKKVMKE